MKKSAHFFTSLILALCLLTSVVPAQVVQAASAAEIQSQLEEIERQQAENKEQQSQLAEQKKTQEKELGNLENDAQAIAKNIKNLNNQINSVVDEMANAQEAMELKNQEIALHQQMIDKKQEEIDARKASMAKRIKYMYENNSKSVLVSLLESDSIGQLFQQLEYVVSITKYDNDMLEEYTAIQQGLVEERNALEIARNELDETGKTLTAKQAELNKLVGDASAFLGDKKSEIAAKNNAIAATEEEIEKMKKTEASLEDSYYAAQFSYAKALASENKESTKKAYEKAKADLDAITVEKDAAAAKYAKIEEQYNLAKAKYEADYPDAVKPTTPEEAELEPTDQKLAREDLEAMEVNLSSAKIEYDKVLASYNAAVTARDNAKKAYESATSEDEKTNGSYSGTDSDVLMLAAIIQAEADNQGTEGRLAVGSVVMNRVFSSKFPNTISEVIYQKNQFAPVASGRFAAILAQGPNAGCIEAAKQCINGYRNVEYLFFCTYSYAASHGYLERTSGIVINAHYFYKYN